MKVISIIITWMTEKLDEKIYFAPISRNLYYSKLCWFCMRPGGKPEYWFQYSREIYSS